MHEPSYGTPAYNDFYKAQLTELLTNYGEISEVWFDGAKGPDAKDMVYDFEGFWQLVRELQPGTVLFSDAGPDVRWVGNEHGYAGVTNWSTITRRGIEIGKADTQLLNMGDPNGEDWMVAECDVSIRPGWFYHPKEDTLVKSLETLMDIYYKSVGRNGTLLLNIPPDRRGLFHETDVTRLREFGEAIRQTFRNDLALNKPVKGSSQRGEHPHYHANLITDTDFYTYWAADEGQLNGSLEIDFGQPATFNTVMLQEPVFMGQRIAGFMVYTWQNDQWEKLTQGTTIGYKRLLKTPTVTTQKLKVEITEAKAVPLLAKIGVFEAY
jgi:alpha-L-fucosidase